MVQLRRQAEAEAERQYNDPYGSGVPVSQEVKQARSEQFARRMQEVVERRQTPSQLSLPGVKPTLMALRYPGLMSRADAIANGLMMPVDPPPLVSPWGGQQLELALGQESPQTANPPAARPARQGPATPPPRKDTILRSLRAVAREPIPAGPLPAPEPARFQANPEERRLAGQLFASGGGGGRPPAGPPSGSGSSQGPLPNGRPRTGVTMAGSRLPGILGLGLASLGGIAGAIVQDDNALTSEVTTSLGLGLGGAGLLAAAALRAPADNYLIRRER